MDAQLTGSLTPFYSDWDPRPLVDPHSRSPPRLTQSRSFLTDVPEAVSYVVLEPVSLTLLTITLGLLELCLPLNSCMAKDGLELLILPDSISLSWNFRHELPFLIYPGALCTLRKHSLQF